MNRRTLVLVFVLGGLALTACSSRSAGVQVPPGRFAETSMAGLEAVAVRETVLEFLDAYARSRETVEPLRDVVAGPELRDWIHWLGVQNRYGTPATGELEVQGVRILQIQDRVAVAAVDATITFNAVGEDGEEDVSIRSFQSPVWLRSDETGSWAVLDVERDGRSMTDSITLLDPPVAVRGHGLKIEAVSVHRFTSGTFVNLRVRNVGGDPVRFDRERSALQVAGQQARALATTATLSGALPHRLVQGAFLFPAVGPTAVPEGLLLRFHGDRGPISLAFPAEAFAPVAAA